MSVDVEDAPGLGLWRVTSDWVTLYVVAESPRVAADIVEAHWGKKPPLSSVSSCNTAAIDYGSKEAALAAAEKMKHAVLWWGERSQCWLLAAKAEDWILLGEGELG